MDNFRVASTQLFAQLATHSSVHIFRAMLRFVEVKRWSILSISVRLTSPSLGPVSLQWRHNGRDSVSNPRLTITYTTDYSDPDKKKKTSKLRVTGLCVGIHRGPVNSPHKWPVTRKMSLFDDVIMHYNDCHGAIEATMHDMAKCEPTKVIICPPQNKP